MRLGIGLQELNVPNACRFYGWLAPFEYMYMEGTPALHLGELKTGV